MNTSPHNEDARFLELLQQWQSGDFTRRDEEELNALASGDDFRMEAMAGFLDHPERDHVKTLDSLQARIRAKQRKRRILFPQLLALAAALTLIFGAIWFFNIRPIPTDTGQVAQDLSVPSDTQQRTEPATSPAPVASVPRLDRAGAAPSASDSYDKHPAAPERSSAKAKDMAPAEDMELRNVAEASEQMSKQEQAPGVIVEQSTNQARPEEIAKAATSQDQKKAKKAPSYNKKEDADKATAGKSSRSIEPLNGWDNLRQYLKTNDRIGYVITDINKKHKEVMLDKLREIEGTIRFRILY